MEESARVAGGSDDAETHSRHTLAVNTLALLSRDDLVDLAWSWLARATQCASGLRTELVSKCDVGKEGAKFSGDAFSFSENAKGLTVNALVNGCCAAVASYADAECGCALEVAEGLAPFFFSREESAMARNEDVDAAAATLEALCFGGQKDDAEQKTSCVSSSATLAATRAVAPSWALACAFQALWCAAFRPWAKAPRHFWVSSALLVAEAVALGSAHRALRAAASAASKAWY